MEKFRDQSLSFEERAADLVSRMTLDEKITWCGTWTSPIPRLGVPAWHYANEASHGINALNYVNDKGYNVTSFPVCLAMGQSWDKKKIKKVTRAISDEIRAAHNIGDESLSFWCPTINLSKDPRNGRSDENFGEDPFLGGKMAAAYIQGFQGADESDKYKKAAATPKHYMLNSSENNRNTGISFADEKTIREYYARVFEYAFREGKAESTMISYNRINGHPAGADYFTMGTLLREEWGFDGYVTSDCGAVGMTYNPGGLGVGQKPGVGHYYYNTLEEASAGTLINGCDISCGGEHRAHLKKAWEQGLITEDQIDKNVIRNVTSLFRQGIFDDKGATPWDGLGAEQLASREHDELALDMANDTIVLLKNDKGLLPIRKEGLKKILVVGPNAKYRELGGYSCGGFAAGGPLDTRYCTLALDAITQEVAADGIDVVYEKGWCAQKEKGGGLLEMLNSIPGVDPEQVMQMMFSSMGIVAEEEKKEYDLPEFVPYAKPEDPDRNVDNEILFARALEAAKDADLVIMVAGTDEATASEGSDRESIALPSGQGAMIEKMLEVNPNTVVVLSVMGTIGDPALDKCHSLICATHAGQEQGKAIANVLFGKVNPNGKLTATWYKDDSQLNHINDYAIRKADALTQEHGRTYWYLDEEPRFPFGYGIHYTTFEYANLRLAEKEIPNGTSLKAYVDVTNTGSMAGKEIVELYVRKVVDETNGEKPGNNKPFRQLKGFEKVELQPGETKTVEIEVPLSDITFWNYFRRKMMIEPGDYVVEVGRSSADLPCSENFAIVGEWDAPLSTVYVELDKYCYAAGETGRMKVVATLADTQRVCLCSNKPVFTSSDEKVATVDADGVVTAHASGTALITAAVTYNGKTVKRSAPVAVK
jgi:beta-glucosidase